MTSNEKKVLSRPPVFISSNSSLDTASTSISMPSPDMWSNQAKANARPPTPTSLPSYLSNDNWANIEPPTTSKQNEIGDSGNNPATMTNYISNVGDANTPANCLTQTSLFSMVGQENSLVAAGAIIPTHNTVAEFLYQLTKMLTDNNREVIEWSNGKIEVHNPPKLASDILHKYFRHSKYASFQRQLNYFGFRKLAGKGKMAPCSYVNDAVTHDLRSLLTIKRKTSTVPSKGKGGRQGDHIKQTFGTGTNSNFYVANSSTSASTSTSNSQLPIQSSSTMLQTSMGEQFSYKRHKPDFPSSSKLQIAVGKGVKHRLNNFLKAEDSTQASGSGACVPSNAQALALAAVGKGVKHKLSTAALHVSDPTIVTNNEICPPDVPLMFLDPPQLGIDIGKSLSELQNNFRNSLNELPVYTPQVKSGDFTGRSSGGKPPDSATSISSGSQGTFSDKDYQPEWKILSRNTSLLDLAMLPPLYSVDPTPVNELVNHSSSSGSLSFLDFTNQDLNTTTNPPES